MSSMMVKQEIKSSLRQVIAKEKGKVYMTGELRVIDLAEDCLREIERLAEIGKAVEAATFEGVAWVTDDSTGTCNYPSEEDVQSLVLWYRAMS